MYKIHVVEEDTGIMPFTYRRPRSPLKHIIQCVRGADWRYVARISAQTITSASLISAGIMVGLNPIGAFLAFTGLGLAFGQEDDQTPEEYRQFVVEHFEKRGEQPPRWTQVVKRGQVWRHRGTLNLILRRHYQVISVRDGVARCLVTDTNGKPITGPDGKAVLEDIGTISLRYAYKLMNRG